MPGPGVVFAETQKQPSGLLGNKFSTAETESSNRNNRLRKELKKKKRDPGALNIEPTSQPGGADGGQAGS